MVHKRGEKAVTKMKIARDELMAVSVVFNPTCISTIAGYYDNKPKEGYNIINN